MCRQFNFKKPNVLIVFFKQGNKTKYTFKGQIGNIKDIWLYESSSQHCRQIFWCEKRKSVDSGCKDISDDEHDSQGKSVWDQ